MSSARPGGLDLSPGRWAGPPLGSHAYVLSADAKTSIQARARCHPSAPPGPGQPQRGEPESARGGALASVAAGDVGAARWIGKPTGIEPFGHWVAKVMTHPPYPEAARGFGLVDTGSSHHPAPSSGRLREAYPKAVAAHLPIHARWLNPIESLFSILQRKVLPPKAFPPPGSGGRPPDGLRGAAQGQPGAGRVEVHPGQAPGEVGQTP